MKLIETLTEQNQIQMLEGELVGIFPELVKSTDPWYTEASDMCIQYYTQRSGLKTISPSYERIRNILNGVTLTTGLDADGLMGKTIRAKFLPKWNRVYQVLLQDEYSPLDEFTYNEHKTGNNSDKMDYASSIEDNGKRATKETTTRDVDNSDNIYGFNSNSPVGTDTSNEATSETVTGLADDNTTHNKRDKTGNDTHTVAINEITDRSGRNKSASSLIREELSLRATQIFFDIVYDDIDSIATLQIYL